VPVKADAARADHGRLLAGDRGDRVAEHVRVFELDRGHDARVDRQRCRRVEASAEPDLPDREIDALLGSEARRAASVIASKNVGGARRAPRAQRRRRSSTATSMSRTRRGCARATSSRAVTL
jgi:hypothetical protein